MPNRDTKNVKKNKNIKKRKKTEGVFCALHMSNNFNGFSLIDVH